MSDSSVTPSSGSTQPVSSASSPTSLSSIPPSNIMYKFMMYGMLAMGSIQDQLYGPIDPTTGERKGGLMGQINDANQQLTQINSWLDDASQGIQNKQDNQPISKDLQKYLYENHNDTYNLEKVKETDKHGNQVTVYESSDSDKANNFKYDKDKGEVVVKNKDEWQTVSTTLSGDSNTIKNNITTLTTQSSSLLNQLNSIMQMSSAGISSAASAAQQQNPT